MSKFKPKTTTNVFSQDIQDTSLEAVDAKLYGTVDLVPNVGRVVIKPVDIMTIWPDLVQPRRAIPLSIRGKWDGNPNRALDVLVKWWQTAERTLDAKIDVSGILQGREQGENGLEIPEGKASVEAFIELLRLGASIFAEGLTNAITIAPRGERFLIETGERRWLAHHLLNEFVDGKFGKIPAREVTFDRFRQASENNNRRKLSATEMARQLAILLMDMYEGDKDVHFDAIEALTFNGCDRRYYAQVAHGRVWQIKKGFAERMQAAMGLPSLDRVADFRKVLRPTDDEDLNDQIWMQADDENWTEFYIRTYVDDLKKQTNVGLPSNVPTGDTWSPLHVSGDSTATTAADSDSHSPTDSEWPSSTWVRKLAYSGPVKVLVTTASEPDKVIVKPEGSEEEFEVNISSLSEYTEPHTPVGTAKPAPLQAAKDWTSRAVQTVTGAVAIVQKDAFGVLHLKFPDDTTATIGKEFASLVEMTEWWEAIKRHKAAQAGGNVGSGNNAGASTSPSKTSSASAVVDFDDEDEPEEDDDFALGQQGQPDYEPFDAINIDMFDLIGEITDMLDIPEGEIIADLRDLDRIRLERVLADTGISEVHKWTQIYEQAMDTVLNAIKARTTTHLKRITEIAEKLTEEK